jgi:hypothetical protein
VFYPSDKFSTCINLCIELKCLQAVNTPTLQVDSYTLELAKVKILFLGLAKIPIIFSYCGAAFRF